MMLPSYCLYIKLCIGPSNLSEKLHIKYFWWVTNLILSKKYATVFSLNNMLPGGCLISLQKLVKKQRSWAFCIATAVGYECSCFSRKENAYIPYLGRGQSFQFKDCCICEINGLTWYLFWDYRHEAENLYIVEAVGPLFSFALLVNGIHKCHSCKAKMIHNHSS